MKNKKGFSLLELLVVILIIGILAAIALPQYQLAVDEARYSKMMDFTKAIADAEVSALIHKDDPTFNDLDIDILPNCTIIDTKTIECDNGEWFCLLNNYPYVVYPRCGDNRINVSYYYTISLAGHYTKRICYAHSKDKNDRANRLCQAMTGKKQSFDDTIYIRVDHSSQYVPSNGYYF